MPTQICRCDCADVAVVVETWGKVSQRSSRDYSESELQLTQADKADLLKGMLGFVGEDGGHDCGAVSLSFILSSF